MSSFHRTLLLQNLAVGNNIAPNVTVFGDDPGGTYTAVSVDGAIRLGKTLTANLQIRINFLAPGASSQTVLGEFTIPSSTPAQTAVEFTTFTNAQIPDQSVFSADILASDGQSDPNGVAEFTLYWDSPGGPAATGAVVPYPQQCVPISNQSPNLFAGFWFQWMQAVTNAVNDLTGANSSSTSPD
jgi:hypothetical protein